MKLGFIGAGMMASALAHGVCKNNLLNGADIMMYDVNADKLTKLQAEVGIVPAKSAEEVFQNCASVIIAVKPQHLATVGYSAGENKPLIISIMAGVTIQALEEKFLRCTRPVLGEEQARVLCRTLWKLKDDAVTNLMRQTVPILR